MSAYLDEIKKVESTINGKEEWKAINPEYSVRMKLQNRFKTGLEIAQYTADIMRKDMADYDADPSQYTQSLGCWHGFIAQQVMMGVKRHRKTTDKSYIYLSGWMVAALRSQFGPLPDQSMHEKLAVPNLIKEIYTFLKRADAVELQHLFNELDEVRENGGDESEVISKIDNFETHVVPIIADIKSICERLEISTAILSIIFGPMTVSIPSLRIRNVQARANRLAFDFLVALELLKYFDVYAVTA